MKFQKFFRAFPPPKFLDIPYAGISISDSAIRCIQFGKKNNNLYIEKHADVDLPVGIITSGQINKKQDLINILQKLKKDVNINYVKVSLPEEKAYLFTSKIPIVKQKDVVSAIESKIEENVPVSPGELVFDYKLIEYREKDHLGVVVSALPINVVETYVDIFKESNLNLLSLEIESQAIARALIKPESFETVLIIHFGFEKVGLYVVRDRIVRFTSTIITKGESNNNPDFLSHEIKKLYLYWHTLKENVDKSENKIKEIIICGEHFDDSVVSYISSHNEVKVSLGNVWTNVFDINVHVPEISFSDSLHHPISVGLALPSDVLIYNNYV